MNQGDKPIENLTGNTRVPGMIYGPATYFSFPIRLFGTIGIALELRRKVLLGYKSVLHCLHGHKGFWRKQHSKCCLGFMYSGNFPE